MRAHEKMSQRLRQLVAASIKPSIYPRLARDVEWSAGTERLRETGQPPASEVPVAPDRARRVPRLPLGQTDLQVPERWDGLS